MRFTALEEYGLRCILHLARRDLEARSRASGDLQESASLTIGDIAEKEGMTEQYAGKIFRVLAKARLVESARGRKGGYRMTRPPEKISVSETLAALGGRMFDRRLCGRYKGTHSSCVHSADCAIRPLWLEVQGLVDGVLGTTTLKDLVLKENALRESLEARAAGEPHVLGPGGAASRDVEAMGMAPAAEGVP